MRSDLRARLDRLDRRIPPDPRTTDSTVLRAFLEDGEAGLVDLPPSPLRDFLLAGRAHEPGAGGTLNASGPVR